MATKLLNYTLDSTQITNPGGSDAMTVQGATVVDGPGEFAGEHYPKALALGTSAAGSVAISDLEVDRRRFHTRVVFRIVESFEGRQNLVESDHLPFALYLNGASDGTVRLVGAVRPTEHGWRGADTRFSEAVIKVGKWHVADLAYDLDTLGIFLDGQIASVRAFPKGRIDLLSKSDLYLGTWVDGRRNHFDGEVAALQLTAGIPPELERQLDERRTSARWFITHKEELLRPELDLGNPATAPTYNEDTGAWSQPYDRGAFMYHPGAGSAFEIHGAIYRRYQEMDDPDELGHLVSDEEVATDERGRKSLFSNGGIYWSSRTGAHEVLGQLYLDYESQGESAAWGFPTHAPQRIGRGQGTELRFERARMYHRDDAPAAFEVHGAILGHFLATGGVSKWGFPVTNELRTADEQGSFDGAGQEIPDVRTSEFEEAKFYWTSRTGAHIVSDRALRDKYDELGGPTGELGVPTADESRIPGVAGSGRVVPLQNGTLCRYGRGTTADSVELVRPFKIHVASLNTKESEGVFMGENDLYFKATIKQGSETLYHERHPSSGDWSGRNVRDVNLTIPVTVTPDPSKDVTFTIDVREADPGDDDHIGKWTKRLNAANAWGIRENNGIIDSGRTKKINNVRIGIHEEVDISRLSELDMFWKFSNRSTDNLSRSQYANAFRDVDSETEWWDITDGLQSIFYEAVAKDIAEGGNCFGLSLEGIYARKGVSPFSLARMTEYDWDTARPTVNVKHAYQVGAAPIWWFVGQFLSGNTHDPKDVFEMTRRAHARGENPVLCLSQNYDFSGAPHCILPVDWHRSGRTWRIDVIDPNRPSRVGEVTIDASENTFEYVGSKTYRGGEWSGGRLHYMPFSVLGTAPRTPMWEAILLFLGGTLLIMGSDTETESITDSLGNDLDAHGERAADVLQNDGRLDGYFVDVPGFDGKGTLAGEMLLTTNSPAPDAPRDETVVNSGAILEFPIRDLVVNPDFLRLRDEIVDVSPDASVIDRRLTAIEADDDLRRRLSDDALDLIRETIETPRPGDFVHRLKGKRRGTAQHVAKTGLAEFHLRAPTDADEEIKVTGKDLDTPDAKYTVLTERDRELDLRMVRKLGVRSDKVEVELKLPAQKDQEITIHPKPGLQAIDLVADGLSAEVSMTATSVLKGDRTTQRFEVPVDGGARLTLPSGAEEDHIKVSQIDRIHGPAISTELHRRL
jgi:hypothetical protein